MQELISAIPKNNSILVLSNYRTGSTALCEYLSNHTNLINLDEIFHRLNNHNEFEKYKNSKIIVKIQPDQIDNIYWNYLIESCFIIGLIRKDIVAQIASLYICDITQHWHDQKNKKNKKYNVDIDIDKIENQCRYIINMNLCYNKLKHLTKIELVYENIVPLLGTTSFSPYTRPENYNEIIEKIKVFLRKYYARTN